jgi:cleavage and polyadenylation specificity factor subunit 2
VHSLCGSSEPFRQLSNCSMLMLPARHLEFFPSPQALLQTYSSKAPKLILAVPASLSHGPSRQLFTEFAAVPDNVVLLTSRSEEGTLGRSLFEKWNNAQRGDDKWDKGKIGRNIMMDGTLKLVVSLHFIFIIAPLPMTFLR